MNHHRDILKFNLLGSWASFAPGGMYLSKPEATANPRTCMAELGVEFDQCKAYGLQHAGTKVLGSLSLDLRDLPIIHLLCTVFSSRIWPSLAYRCPTSKQEGYYLRRRLDEHENVNYMVTVPGEFSDTYYALSHFMEHHTDVLDVMGVAEGDVSCRVAF